MKQVHFTTREPWRAWLKKHHATQSEVWLVFFKKHTGEAILPYEDAVEEALCFGWVDSLLQKLDEDRYARKFTPRTKKSNWSKLNRQRAAKMIKAKKMTRSGQIMIADAKRSGTWNPPEAGPPSSTQPPAELQAALKSKSIARKNFDALSPSCKKQYVGWIATAKKQETRERRAKQAVDMLEQGKNMGMK